MPVDGPPGDVLGDDPPDVDLADDELPADLNASSGALVDQGRETPLGTHRPRERPRPADLVATVGDARYVITLAA